MPGLRPRLVEGLDRVRSRQPSVSDKSSDDIVNSSPLSEYDFFL